jgi:Tol biopolymer transport system component
VLLGVPLFVHGATGNAARRAACEIPPDLPATTAVARLGGDISFVSERAGTRDLYTMNANGSAERPLVRNRPPAAWVDWSVDCRFVFQRSDGDQLWTTNDDGTDLRRIGPGSYPAWSPDGGRIAYLTNAPAALWIVNADGSGRRRLASAGVGDVDGRPAWSPHGTEILFIDVEDRLRRVDVASGHSSRVGSMDGADAVAWSPDGARIAVVDSDIWTMTPDGREAQQITHSASEVKSSPVWRSDGTLTFLLYDDAAGTNEVRAIRPGASTQQRLFTVPGLWPEILSWSPAGQAVVSSNFADRVVVVDAGGSDQRQILRGDSAEGAAFSPDGRRIALSTRQGLALLSHRGLRRYRAVPCGPPISWAPAGRKLTCNQKFSDVMLVDLTRPAARMRVLLEDTGIGDPSKDSADWSPDGRRLVYVEDNAALGIYAFARPAARPTYIPVKGTYNKSSPEFSPDGRQVVFAGSCAFSPTYIRCRAGIFVVDLDGSGLRRLSRDGANPTWNRAGTKIAFDSMRGGNRDIYVMDADGRNRVRLTTDPGPDYDPSWRR